VVVSLSGIHRIKGIHSRVLSRRQKGAKGVLSDTQKELLTNPERGDLVLGLGGIRKARAANPLPQKRKVRRLSLSISSITNINRIFTFSISTGKTNR